MAPPTRAFDYDAPPSRLWLIPAASVLAGSLATLLPLAGPLPLMPPLGLMMLIGWRLLRPELWGAWVALPLGLADDLIGGAPLGSAMILWTVALLLLDIADARIMWRDRVTDWWLAAALLAFDAIGDWAIARFCGGGGAPWTIAPAALLGLLCFPLAARACAALDRVRLRAAGIR